MHCSFFSLFLQRERRSKGTSESPYFVQIGHAIVRSGQHEGPNGLVFFFVDIIDQNMIDCQKILEIADRELAGTDLFTVSCKCSPMNEVELLIDSDTHVTIERCAELSRKIEAEFDREVEDFSLTVASAGIGTELKNIRQYRKLIGQSVEVLLLSGVKVLAKLDAVTEEGITISYEEKQAVEGKKRKVLVNVERTFNFDEIKYTKEYLDFK